MSGPRSDSVAVNPEIKQFLLAYLLSIRDKKQGNVEHIRSEAAKLLNKEIKDLFNKLINKQNSSELISELESLMSMFGYFDLDKTPIMDFIDKYSLYLRYEDTKKYDCLHLDILLRVIDFLINSE